mgnify:CR=1 FL=1
MGKTMFSNANIWPPLLAEDLIVFSVVACIAFASRKYANGKVSEGSQWDGGFENHIPLA